MTRVLLTGASGFVGRQVAAALDAQGHEIVIVLRRGSVQRETKFEAIETDNIFTESDKSLVQMVSNVSTIVHVAWYTEPGKYLTSQKNLDCLIGTVRLARAAMVADVKRFVGIGTCFEYDLRASDAQGTKQIEPDASLGPATVYGASKAATFLTLERAFAETATSFAWCRLFYLYGEGEDSRRLLPYVLGRIKAGQEAELTSGTQIRDFLDVVQAGRQIAEIATGSYNGPVNVCSGKPITVRDFIRSQVPASANSNLLKFGARPMRSDEEAYVVGRPGGLPARGWVMKNERA